jgi:hypothetical protein
VVAEDGEIGHEIDDQEVAGLLLRFPAVLKTSLFPGDGIV